MNPFITIGIPVFIVLFLLIIIPMIVSSFLRNVPAGEIRIVSWLSGKTNIYRGPGKSLEVPLLTTGTTLSSKAINVDLDITDQTADVDENNNSQPIKVRVLASAIVSVGNTSEEITTAANRFFAKPADEQTAILIDLLSSSGRRATNLLTHNQLFSAKPKGTPDTNLEDDDDTLAIIIKRNCSKELTDLGLSFNSLNIKSVTSEVAEALRRQSAAQATANADIVATQQVRRAREEQINAERVIAEKTKELETAKASYATDIAKAEASKQEALALQRSAELKATQIAQASADANRLTIEVEARANAEALQITKIAKARADAEALNITTVANATAASIEKINAAIKAGGNAYLENKRVEMLPALVPAIAKALAQAKIVTISGSNDGAANQTAQQIGDVIKTMMGIQVMSNSGVLNTGAQVSGKQNSVTEIFDAENP